MRYSLIARPFAFGTCLILLASVTHAQDSSATHFGLGYAVGSSSGVDLSWNCPHHQIDLLLNASYSTTTQPESLPDGGFTNYQTTNEYVSIGLNYFWICNIDKNFSLVYGPSVMFGGTEIKTQPSSLSVQGNSTDSYFTTHLGFGVGPEYWFNSHFVIQGISSLGANITGNSTVSSSTAYPYPTTTTYFIGGAVSVRYIF